MSKSSEGTEFVGDVSTALQIAGALGALVPQATAVAATATLVGGSGELAARYFKRRQVRNDERAAALKAEVIERRLAAVERAIEVNEGQIDLVAHIFEQFLADDEDAKERYYGALVEMVLREMADVQTIKILRSAVSALSSVELQEFEHVCDLDFNRYLFRAYKLRGDGAPRDRDHRYQNVFVTRLLSVCLIEAHTSKPGKKDVIEKGETPKTSYQVTRFGAQFLYAVKQEVPVERPPVTGRVTRLRLHF